MSIKIKELPESERPYEKLEMYGEKSLSNAELLAIIIKSGTKEETSIQLAQKILKLNDSKEENLNYLQNITIEELQQIKGIGKVKAIQLKAVAELSIRMFKKVNYRKVVIKKPIDIARVFMSELKFEKNEKIKVVILNTKNEILKIKEVASGGVNFANFNINQIILEPIKMNAPKFILVHNHPSGDSTPSKQDIFITNKVYDLSQSLGIQLVDHIVIGDMNYTSIFFKILQENNKNTKDYRL